MEKTKNVLLGVREKKRTSKQKKQTLFGKVLDYLQADSYMFSPFISSSSSSFSAPMFISSSASGLRTKNTVIGKKKKLVRKVGDYLKSDSYMYAPLVSPRLVVPAAPGKSQPIKKFAIGRSTRSTNLKQNQPIVQSDNMMSENGAWQESSLAMGIVENQVLGNGETVKHLVYQNCRSSSMSGHILNQMKCSRPRFMEKEEIDKEARP